jgi:hypothetical protein
VRALSDKRVRYKRDERDVNKDSEGARGEGER